MIFTLLITVHKGVLIWRIERVRYTLHDMIIPICLMLVQYLSV